MLGAAGAMLALGPQAGMGALAQAKVQPGGMPVLLPPRLKAGDTVGLIEPASATWEPFAIQLIEEALGNLGLKSKRAHNILDRDGYFAGDDKARADGVNQMFGDTDVNAIMSVRGGWGTARILPHLDFDLIGQNPKALIGYSDITALHLAIHAKTKMVTFHGPVGISAWGKQSLETFKPLLFDAAMPDYVNPVAAEDRLVQRKWRTQTITPGKARGRLLGGNLTVMTALVGTPYLPSFDGAILFFEDIDEAVYRVDRMLTQLGQAGILGGVAGVIVGNCTDCSQGNSIGGFTLTEILDHHLKPLGVPAFSGAFIGHLTDQFTVPEGGRVEMDADAGTFRLLEPAVR
jgi:muramoyltetrapeptide carboxypeptidase